MQGAKKKKKVDSYFLEVFFVGVDQTHCYEKFVTADLRDRFFEQLAEGDEFLFEFENENMVYIIPERVLFAKSFPEIRI